MYLQKKIGEDENWFCYLKNKNCETLPLMVKMKILFEMINIAEIHVFFFLLGGIKLPLNYVFFYRKQKHEMMEHVKKYKEHYPVEKFEL